jgi:hypothetical protein
MEKMLSFLFLLIACVMSLQPSGYAEEKAGFVWMQELMLHSDAVGLFALGSLLQITAFPFLGLHVGVAQLSLPVQLFFVQLVPAFAVLPFFLRLSEKWFYFGKHGVLLFSIAFFLLIAGLCQSSWERLMRVWSAAGFLFAFGLMFLVSQKAGLSFFIGVSFSVALFSALFEMSCQKKKKGDLLSTILIVFLPLGMAMGLIGFISHMGLVLFFEKVFAFRVFPLFFCFCYVLFAVSAFMIAFRLGQKMMRSGLNWNGKNLTVLFFWLLAGVGILWTGSWSASGASVEIAKGILHSFYPEGFSSSLSAEKSFKTESGLFFMQLIVGLLSFWLWRLDRRTFAKGWFLRPIAFCEAGYGIHGMAAFCYQMMAVCSSALTRYLDDYFWQRFFPYSIFAIKQSISQGVYFVQEKMSYGLVFMLSFLVNHASSLLRKFLMGDVQYYLVFSLIFIFFVAFILISK